MMQFGSFAATRSNGKEKRASLIHFSNTDSFPATREVNNFTRGLGFSKLYRLMPQCLNLVQVCCFFSWDICTYSSVSLYLNLIIHSFFPWDIFQFHFYSLRPPLVEPVPNIQCMHEEICSIMLRVDTFLAISFCLHIRHPCTFTSSHAHHFFCTF